MTVKELREGLSKFNDDDIVETIPTYQIRVVPAPTPATTEPVESVTE